MNNSSSRIAAVSFLVTPSLSVSAQHDEEVFPLPDPDSATAMNAAREINECLHAIGPHKLGLTEPSYLNWLITENGQDE